MRETVSWLTWLAQIPPQSDVPADAATAPPAGPGGFGTWQCLLPAAAGLMLMYLMMAAKPRQADAQKSREQMSSLKKNDKVITAGGIFGIVVQASSDSEYVTIRIDETNNTRIKILKSSIGKVIAEDTTEKDKEA